MWLFGVGDVIGIVTYPALTSEATASQTNIVGALRFARLVRHVGGKQSCECGPSDTPAVVCPIAGRHCGGGLSVAATRHLLVWFGLVVAKRMQRAYNAGVTLAAVVPRPSACVSSRHRCARRAIKHQPLPLPARSSGGSHGRASLLLRLDGGVDLCMYCVYGRKRGERVEWERVPLCRCTHARTVGCMRVMRSIDAAELSPPNGM